ncbi:DUF2207 family protein [Gracilimonas sp.]|uniref:DUF2207 family protein n=1 Tax=Gracilimonas sp. TaxID=1974203 RepID=UPI002871AF57|nr:DUF2207 domain-containing protein [Gracilimonas sp.]
MKIYKLAYLLLFAVTFLIYTLDLSAKDYSIPTIQVDVHVDENGTITITEHRTYVFDGSYSWANYRLPKTGYSAMQNIRITEGDRAFTNLNTEEPGTFLVEESDEAFNIKWFFEAEDEERTFTVTYTLEDALVIGPEWSEFFWTYVASGREKSTDDLDILIQLPYMVPDSSLHSWVREPGWDITTDFYDNGFQFTGENISRSQAVTIRTVFPTSVFDENSVQVSDSDFSLTLAREQEDNFREEQRRAAEEEERSQALAIEISIVIAGLSIIAFIFFYRKYGSRHKVNLSANESIMLPGREKPAAIGWLLMNRTVTYSFITATLLDLARRKYFKVEEKEPDPDEKSWLSSNDDSHFTVHRTDKPAEQDMTEYELSLLNYVEKRITEKGHKFEDIFKFSESDASKWFYSWKKKLKSYCKSKEWVDPTSYKGLWWNIGIQSILLTASIFGIFLIHPLMGFTVLVVLFGWLLSFAIVRRTPKGEELYQRWKNYLKALKSAKEHSISQDKLGLHFIYGIAFGLNQDQIESLFEQNPGAVSAIYWIVLLPNSTSSPADMANSLSNLAATGSTSAGGGSFGGGASAGVAGGGASGGAG